MIVAPVPYGAVSDGIVGPNRVAVGTSKAAAIWPSAESVPMNPAA